MIIDTTLFNKDFTTLELRLAELANIVDLFVICESPYTHSGLRKQLYLTENIHLFKKYSHKIRVVIDSKKHLTNIGIVRQTHQKKRISKFLKQFRLNSKDLIMYSDCDEIPNSKIIEKLSGRDSVNALLELQGYSNYLNTESDLWPRARVVTFNNYTSIEDLTQDIFFFNLEDRKGLRNYLVRVPFYWTTRNFYFWKLPVHWHVPNIELIRNAGWHFNNLFSANEILMKIQSSAHTEFNTLEVRNNAFDNFIKGKDIYTGRKYKIVNIDDTFPKEVVENLEKYDSFIYKEI